MEQINYGATKLFYSLKIMERKTLSIEVHPDKSILVIAPCFSKPNEIRNKILKNARWIVKQQAYFDQFLPRTESRLYVSGETHKYLGKRYVLKIRDSDINNIKLLAGQLIIHAKNSNPLLVKNLLTSWYYNHAIEHFTKLFKSVALKFESDNVKEPALIIRKMPNRWGSCTPKGKILLNPELIKAPKPCIEYVITHEFCHMIYPRHNKSFYNLLTEKMPNWQFWKTKLEISMA